jgi:hypothetical protein
MNVSKRRLDQIQKYLTAKQRVIAWLEGQQHRFKSYAEYLAWIVEQPDAVYPMSLLVPEMEAAVRVQKKGATKEEIDRATLREAKEIGLLFFLFDSVNEYVSTEMDLIKQRATSLSVLIRTACRHEVAAMQAQELLRLLVPALDGRSDSQKIVEKVRRLGAPDRTWIPYDRNLLRMMFPAHARAVLSISAVIKYIEEEFFKSHQLLFNSEAEKIAELKLHLSDSAAFVKGFLSDRRLNRQPRQRNACQADEGDCIDLGAIEKSIIPKQESEFVVNRAREYVRVVDLISGA